MKDQWALDDLLSHSLSRMRARFFPYLYTVGVGLLMILAYAAASVLGIVFIGKLALMGPQLRSLVVAFGLIYGIGMTYILLYILSLLQLWSVAVIIHQEKKPASEVMKEVRPLVKGWIWYTALYTLFMCGLLPFGVMTVGVLFILWSVWGCFSIYVYLSMRLRGLLNLWMSKALIDEFFWKIVGRIVLVGGLYYMSQYILSYLQQHAGDIFISGLIIIVSFVLQVLWSPFFIAFLYMLFQQTKVPQTYPQGAVWKKVSAIGYLCMIVGAAALFMFFLNQPQRFRMPQPFIPPQRQNIINTDVT